MGHVTALELTSLRRQGLKLRTRDSAEAHLSKEARFRTAGHVAILKPTSIGRCAPYLDLELICEVTNFQFTDIIYCIKTFYLY
jgi:hypothetical protein